MDFLVKIALCKVLSMIFANGPNKKATWIKGIFILVLGPPAFLQVHYTPTSTNPARWIE
jgi:hypothetical protein